MNIAKRYAERKKRYDDVRLMFAMGIEGVTRSTVRRALVAYERVKREYEQYIKEQSDASKV